MSNRTIEQNLTLLSSTKRDIRNAINIKGGSVSSATPFANYATAISNLPSGGGGGADLDWSLIGYSARPSSIDDAYAYARAIYLDWDSTQTNLSYKFANDKELVYLPLVDTSNATYMDSTFSGCFNLTTISTLDTSHVTNMMNAFNGCNSLMTVSQLNASACTNMYGMFSGCKSLTTISILDTSHVTNMQHTFSNCESLTDIPALNTSACTNMYNMFHGCSSLSGATALSGYDFQNVENCGDMFSDTNLSIATLPVMNTVKCTNFWSMLRFNSTALTRVEGIYLNAWKGGQIFGDWSSPTAATNHPNLTYVMLYNLGMSSSANNEFDLSCLMDWGDGGSANHQSLIDSLYTNAFDRATAGYVTRKIYLHPYVYARLSEQEIDNIESKGYQVKDRSQGT